MDEWIKKVCVYVDTDIDIGLAKMLLWFLSKNKRHISDFHQEL